MSRPLSIADINPRHHRQILEQLRSQQKSEKPRKYRNEPTAFKSVQGFELVAASKAEAKRYQALDQLIKAQVVVRWVPQVSFLLPGQPSVRYKCDALVWWANGRVTVEDTKGMMTKAFRDRQRLMLSTYGIEIELVR